MTGVTLGKRSKFSASPGALEDRERDKILIVEDYQECGKLLCEVVRRMGLNYLLARNIPEAARVLAQQKSIS